MKRMKGIFVLLALLLVFATVIGCAPEKPQGGGDATEPAGEGEQGEQPGTKKDEVIISLATELATLNILAQRNIVTNEVLSNVYGKLVNLGEKGSADPAIASSWEWDDDENKYTFHIRSDIKFHDGSMLTAEDVGFTLELMTGELESFHSNIADQVKEVKVIDEETVDVYLNGPSANFLYLCALNVSVVSKDAYLETDGFEDTIVSCGPYKFVSADSASGVVLEAFEDYYGDVKPKIKTVIFKIIPDANTQLIALETGEINISRDFAMIALNSINENPDLEVFSHPCGMVQFLMFNLKDSGLEPLKNEKVRQAINYAINTDFIIEVAEEGLAVPARSIANTNMSGYSEEIFLYPYDVEKAKSLLEEAGYADGFEIPVMITREGKGKKVAEIVLENLKAIGITTSIQVIENNAFIDDLKTNNYYLASTHLNLGTDGGHAMDAIAQKGTLAFTGIDDAWIEEEQVKQLGELDPEVRSGILEGILKEVAEKAYFVPIYYPSKNYAISKGLKINDYDPFVGLQLLYLEWAE